MYKKVDEFNNANGNYILDENLIFGVNNTLHLYGKSKKIQIPGNISRLTQVQNKVFVEFFSKNDGFERTLMFDKNLSKINDDYFVKKMIRDNSENIVIALSYDKKFNTIPNIIDINNNELLWTGNINPYGFCIINSDLALFWNNHKIELINYSLNITVKTYEILKKDIKIKKILGLYKNSLLFLFENGLISSLDIKSNEIKDLYNLSNTSLPKNLIRDSIFLDKKKNKLKCLNGRYYFEIDLNSLKIEIKKDFGEYKNGNWWISKSISFKDMLTFTGSKDGISTFPNSYGIFNTDSCEIEWSDGIKPTQRQTKGFYPTPPTMNENFLVVKGSEKNLHIYEKIK